MPQVTKLGEKENSNSNNNKYKTQVNKTYGTSHNKNSSQVEQHSVICDGSICHCPYLKSLKIPMQQYKKYHVHYEMDQKKTVNILDDYLHLIS
eukprot:23649_1